MIYTFKTLGPAIRSHVERVAVVAVAKGLAPEVGIEIADRGKVKTGRMTASVDAGVSAPPDGDVGVAPGKPSDYPPRHFLAPTRADLRSDVAGAKFGDKLYLSDTVPYAAARAAQDEWIEPSIDAVAERWPQVATEAARGVRHA